MSQQKISNSRRNFLKKGVAGLAEGDAGVTARIFSSFLTWMTKSCGALAVEPLTLSMPRFFANTPIA